MTKQEQIEEIAKYICNVCEMGHGFNGDCSEGGTDHYKHCTLTQETAEAIYEAGYRKSPDKKIVFIDVSEPKKERIIPEGEPIKDIGAKGALGKEGKTSCDEGEYKNRFEIADKVLTETRAKLARNTKMTKDEIKKALATCIGASCGGCAYFGIHDCCDKIKRDARACIIEQEKEIAGLKAAKNDWKQRYESLDQRYMTFVASSTECIDKKVKKAKIDVLNELKDKMFEREYMGVKYKERIFYESEINDMIAEVQNAADKG